MERRHELAPQSRRGGFVSVKYLAEATASPLHQVKTVEEIGDDWVAAHGIDLTRLELLDELSAGHATWRIDFHPVVEHINVNLAPDLQIIAMDERVHYALVNGF